MKTKNLKIFDSKDKMSREAIEIIKSELKKKDRISIGFSGGKTPITFFKLLALENNINWEKIDIFSVDERWDKSGEDTLKNLITSNLLSKIEIPTKNLHLIDYYDSITTTKSKYMEKLNSYFNNNIEFDLLFLGVGSDGHTASIFELEEGQEKDDVIITNSNRHPHSRISLGMKVINSSKRKIFLLGPEKLELLEEPLDSQLPISLVKDPEFLSYKE